MLTSDLDPKTWEKYWYNEHQKKVLRKFIRENNHPPAITLSGTSGTGKTALARLYINTTMCKRREPGSDVGCGECPVCKSDPRTVGPSGNVTWVQQGQAQSITLQLNKAIDEANQPPNGFADEHRYYKFVVIDELQTVPRDQIQRLLFFPELKKILKQNRVIFIFITMDESAIDPSIMRPLADRSFYFRFRPFESNQVVDYLKSIRPKAPLESLKILADTSGGSIRSAISSLDKCETYDENLYPVSVGDVMMYADSSARSKLWTLIQDGKFMPLLSYWKVLSTKVDSENLIRSLMNDLETAMSDNFTEDLLDAHKELMMYFTSAARINAFDLLKVLLGRKLFNPDILISEEDKDGFSKVFG